MRDWASARRGRWSASRIVAALALHALLLAGLTLAIDRVEMPRGADRATTLLEVVLHAAPPPPRALPPPRPARPKPPPARASRAPATRDTEPQPITLPAPAAPPVAAAAPPASTPDLRFLDGAAARQAIRDAARGQTLASMGNAITSTEQTSGERLAAGVAAAHKADCMKDFSGAVLLAAPLILLAEATGKCAHKL